MKERHDLDEGDIDELGEKDEISGSEQLQSCSVWCKTHRKYEWHMIWRPLGAEAVRKRKRKLKGD